VSKTIQKKCLFYLGEKGGTGVLKNQYKETSFSAFCDRYFSDTVLLDFCIV